MKRSIIKVVSLLLFCILTVSVLSSCSFDSRPSWLDENTVNDENVKNDNTNGEINNDSQCEFSLNELDADSDPVLTLINFLNNRMMQSDKADISIADSIDKIKNGSRPLLVDFNSSRCYFVCGYYSPSCEYESLNYCCTDKYTWVRYENATDIRKSYKNKDMVVAFQFNIASSVRNIVSEEDSPSFENFNMLETKFANGLNVNESVVYDKCWLYIDQSGKSTIYETSYQSAISGYNYKTRCIYLDGEHYLLFRLFDDQSYNDYFYSAVEFKAYYDDMMSILIADKYSVQNNDGSVTKYGLIDIRDFADKIINKGD